MCFKGKDSLKIRLEKLTGFYRHVDIQKSKASVQATLYEELNTNITKRSLQT